MTSFQKSSKDSSKSHAQQLQSLALHLIDSGCQVEENWWKQQLSDQLTLLLDDGHEAAILEALDSLHNEENTPPKGSEGAACAEDALLNCVEDAAESISFEINGQSYIALLVAIPMLAWSRYAIPSGNLSKPLLSTLATHFSAHILASSNQLVLADFLFSPDQLPDSFAETRRLLSSLKDAGLAGTHLHVEADSLPETSPFLADARYLLAAVIAPSGKPIFRWQEGDGEEEASIKAWQQQGLINLEPLFTSCAFEGLPPNAYFTACRRTDQAARPYAIQASVAFLQAMMSLDPAEIQATIAACYDKNLIEYRVGLGALGSSTVLQGTVWPLMGEQESSDDTQSMIADIETALRAAGIVHILILEERFDPEVCDDCGTPLYPSPDRELAHIELPESVHQANQTLH